jgi:hypothetical protein
MYDTTRIITAIAMYHDVQLPYKNYGTSYGTFVGQSR